MAAGRSVIAMAAKRMCIATIDQKIVMVMPGVGKIPVSAISGNRSEMSKQADARIRYVPTGRALMRLTSSSAPTASSR